MPSDEQIDQQHKLEVPSDEQIAQQQDLLATHRRTLAHYLRQQAELGIAYLPPGIAHGIEDTRANIRRIKQVLRDWAATVADHPDDERSATTELNTKAEQPVACFSRESGGSTTRQEPFEGSSADTRNGSGIIGVHPEQEKRNIPADDLPKEIDTLEVRIQIDLANGAETESFTLKVKHDDLPKEFDTLEAWKEEVFARLIGKGVLQSNSPDWQRLRELGRILFERLFPDSPEHGRGLQCYRELANKAKTNGSLRTWLNLPAELEAIPWELLLCPVNNSWLAVDTSRALVRTLPLDKCRELPNDWSREDGPLRIVVVMAGPEQDHLTPSLRNELQAHKQHLQDCHATLERGEEDVKIEYIEGAGTYQQLVERLSQPKPIHVLHIFYHGEPIGDEAVLKFVKEASGQNIKHDDGDPIRSSILREHIRKRFTSFPNERIQLVVLNACFNVSAAHGGLLKNLAAELVQEGVPAVIAMQGRAEPKVVHELARTLYESLWNAESIDRALTKARSQLYNPYIPTLEWAIPVLFLHPQAKNRELQLFARPRLRLERPASTTISPEQFLEAHGLGTQANNKTFFFTFAEDMDPTRLRETFVSGPLRLEGRTGERPQPIDKMLAQLNELQSFFLFAPDGYGKTSYRRRMESDIEKIRENSPLIVHFDFVRELASVKRMTIGLYVRNIKRTTYEVLRQKFDREPKRKDKLQQDSTAWGYFLSLEREFKPRLRNFSKDDNTYWLGHLSQIAIKSEFSGICFTLEDLNQVEEDPIKAFGILKPLIRPNLLSIPRFSFKFFLSDNLATFILQALAGRINNIKIYRIGAWSNTQLRNLLGELLYHYYKLGSREAPPESIAQFRDLCAVDFDVDTRLINAAQGSPRVLIELVEKIIKLNCEMISNPKDLIRDDAINRILRDYER